MELGQSVLPVAIWLDSCWLTWPVGSPGQVAHLASWLTWPDGSPGQLAHLASWLTWPGGSFGMLSYLASRLTWPDGSPGQLAHLTLLAHLTCLLLGVMAHLQRMESPTFWLVERCPLT